MGGMVSFPAVHEVVDNRLRKLACGADRQEGGSTLHACCAWGRADGGFPCANVFQCFDADSRAGLEGGHAEV